MNDLQERIRNFNSLSQRVQDELSKLDPQIAVYSNKLENLASQEREKQNQIANNQKQTDSLKQKLTELSQNGEISVKRILICSKKKLRLSKRMKNYKRS